MTDSGQPVCVYCQKPFNPENPATVEHPFPDSWYPRHTPTSVKRFTIPVCRSCNNAKSLIDADARRSLAVVLDSRDLGYEDIYESHMRSLDARAGKTEHDADSRRRNRKALLGRITAATRVTPESLMPMLGDIRAAITEDAWAYRIDTSKLSAFYEFLIRGLTYELFNKHVIVTPECVRVRLHGPNEVRQVIPSLFAKARFTPFAYGPGLMGHYIATKGTPFVAFYEVLIWERHCFFAYVGPASAVGGLPESSSGT